MHFPRWFPRGLGRAALAGLALSLAACSDEPLAPDADRAAPVVANAPVASATTVVVRTNPGAGWAFNGDPNYVTPAAFTGDEASLGNGSIHVPPITNAVNGIADKFILGYGPTAPVGLSELESFSIDFLIDDEGTNSSASQFYVNLYTLTPDPGDGGWYDCRFDYVATAGSIATWTTLGFDGATIATAVASKLTVGACPASYDGMPVGSVAFAVAVNLGDTSGSDTGVGGYFDNALMTVGGETTVWDFEEPDTEGPVTTALTTVPNPVAVGSAYDIQALVDDATTGGSIVASASYSIDGGSSVAMGAADGAFDEVGEGVTASATAPIDPGLYGIEVCVEGTDAAGNTGNATCEQVQLVVYDPSGGFVTGGGWIDSPAGATIVPGTPWAQDFSVDDDGWLDDDDGWHGDIAVSGGEATFLGNATSAPFSRFDGYRDTWPGSWTAEIDVYLDPSWPTGEGFDYSVAATGSDGAHQRDFIFHVGTVEDYGPVSGKALLVNGSNNADFATNPYKLVNDNGGNFHVVASPGWYTLQHVFRDAGGYLAVDLNLLDAGGAVLWTATRANTADLIPDEVGGNRYSWFTHIDVAGGIQVDDHELHMNAPGPAGRASFGFVSRYKKGASVPDGNTQFTFQAGGLDFHSSSYDWLVVNQGSANAQFKGEGTVNGQGPYKFMLWAGDHDTGDTFRIKIWQDTGAGEAVVYDNGTDQAIGGGNIVVHDGKSRK